MDITIKTNRAPKQNTIQFIHINKHTNKKHRHVANP